MFRGRARPRCHRAAARSAGRGQRGRRSRLGTPKCCATDCSARRLGLPGLRRRRHARPARRSGSRRPPQDGGGRLPAGHGLRRVVRGPRRPRRAGGGRSPGPHADADAAAGFVAKRIRRERRRVLALLEDPAVGSATATRTSRRCTASGRQHAACGTRCRRPAGRRTSGSDGSGGCGGCRTRSGTRSTPPTLPRRTAPLRCATPTRPRSQGGVGAGAGAFALGVLATTERAVVERQVTEGRRLLTGLGAALRG